ncbi:MAG: hypothetical protein WBS17_04030 [Candidatus Acidiferrales bacterium]
MSEDFRIETGRKTLSERLGVTTVAAPDSPALDNLQELAVRLRRLSTDLGGVLNAATFTERSPSRIQMVSFELFAKDSEMATSLLRQLEGVSERVSAAHQKISATQIEGKSL